nr:MAG TPA: minor tail protein [Caudoviricetes sp.]
MASLDLGTLFARIKVEGADKAKSVLRGVSESMGNTSKSATGASGGVSSFANALKSGLGNVSMFGTNLGTLAAGFGTSEAASIAMGTALGGVCTAGILAAVRAVKALGQACIEFIADSNQVGIGFQAQMSKVQAIAMGTKGDLNTLTDAARRFGKETVFSATEVAQAFEYTALAGYSTNESISAMPGILNLAAASGMDLARASDIVTDNITAFGLEVDKANHLSDIMAYTMSHTNTNTEQLGEAYKACAATCASFGVSAEEASAWLGKMADAGYKGEQAGTALNAILARMYGETKTTNDAMQQYGLTMYDETGKAKNFTTVMAELQDKMKGMNDEQRNVFMKAVAGTNQLSKFATMTAASAEEVSGLTNALVNCDGASEKMVQAMNDNIAGLQKSIGSKAESIKISIFSAFSPLEKDVLNIFDALLNGLSTLLQPVGSVVGAFLDMFSPIFSGFNRLISIISNLVGDVLEPFKKMFVFSFGEMGSAISFVVDLIVGAVDLVAKFIHPIIDILNVIVDVITQIGGALKKYLLDQFPGLKSGVTDFIEAFKDGFLLLPNIIITGINKCIDAINMLPNVTVEKVDYLTESYAQAMQNMGDDTADFVGSANDKMEDFSATVDEITDANYTSFEDMYNAIMELDDETFGKLKDNVNEYKNEYDLMTDALDEFEKEKSREIMKTWEKTNKSREGTMQYYLDKAKHQATVEEALHNKTMKEREKLDKEYTGKVETELKKQKNLYEKYGINNYAKDYNEFAKNEEKKTAKYKEELDKRSKSGNSILSSIGKSIGSSFSNIVIPGSGILGGFANGTASVSKTGVYRVGEFGPEYVTLPKGASVTPNNSIGTTDMRETNSLMRSMINKMDSIESRIDSIPWQQKNLNQVWG